MKLSECFSEFKYFKRCGYDFRMVLALLVSIVAGPDKTVNSYRKSIPGEDCGMGKDVFYRLKNNPRICWRMVLWHVALRFRYDNYESKGALYRAMNGEVLRETLDRRLWGLFQEMLCTVAEILGIDALDLLERLVYNPQGESMVAALWITVGKNGNSETG